MGDSIYGELVVEAWKNPNGNIFLRSYAPEDREAKGYGTELESRGLKRIAGPKSGGTIQRVIRATETLNRFQGAPNIEQIAEAVLETIADTIH